MKKLMVFCMTVCLPLLTFAQIGESDFDDFADQSNFEAFNQQANQRFNDFRDTMNARFARELARQWVEFESFAGEKRPARPEPKEPVVAPKDKTPREPVQMPVDEVVPAPMPREDAPKEMPNNQTPQDLQEAEAASMYNAIQIDFYSRKLSMTLPVAYQELKMDGISEKSVAKFWEGLSKTDFQSMVAQCQKQRNELNMNDWALFGTVKELASEQFASNYAEQTVFVAFLMDQLGLDVQLARVEQQLVLLLPMNCSIYEVPYLQKGNKLYYMFNIYPTKPNEQMPVYSYKGEFSASAKALDMNIYESIGFKYNPSMRTYQTDLWGDTISYCTNRNEIDFYSEYPQVDIAVYANAQVSANFLQWLDTYIKPELEGMTKAEQVLALMMYVQYGFDYATDQDQFGYEKPFFCEENFFYPKNDCEDRSILLSCLIRHLLGLKVVLLDYPEHIATAVSIPDLTIQGDYYLIDGEAYYVCDPTYIGAGIGESMPQYQDIRATVIKLRN